MGNPLTHSIVVGGLEPFLQFNEVLSLVSKFRELTADDIIIYTGYDKKEVKDEVAILSNYENITVKFGRFIPDGTQRYDPVLGINLASSNQYAEKIS